MKFSIPRPTMLIKLFILGLIASSVPVQAFRLMCHFQYVNNVCTCVFLIFNPNGENQLAIGGNPIPTCTFSNAAQILSTGVTTNIPTVICESFPMLESLAMEGIQIETLEPNPFHLCSNLKTLRLKGNRIPVINSHAFSNTKLQTLDLSYNRLQSLNNLALYNLGDLRSLNLQSNSGIYLPPNVFDSIYSLVTLDLRSCRISTIETGWFKNITNLNTLHLSSNSFQTIPSTAFNNLRNLVYLSMSYGSLSSLPANTFYYNTRLQTLLLNQNSLSSISASLFANIQNLVTLSLSYNSFNQIPVNTFQSLTSIRTFSCDGCNINRIEIGWFRTMRNLISVSLADNQMTEIPWNAFTSTDRLESIYLSGNNIVKLEARSFGSLSSLYTLDARNNRIFEIDHYFMNQSTVMSQAYFSGNRCIQLNMDNFIANKAANMQQMTGCFNNFDQIMIGECDCLTLHIFRLKLSILELETFNSTLFDWHNIRPNDEWEAIRVSIKATENAHIGLTDSLDGGDPLVEIHIGERDNRDSSIYERGNRVIIDYEHRRLNGSETRTFLIGWKFGIVMVYEEAQRFPFMAHFIRKPFPVNFFGMRTQ